MRRAPDCLWWLGAALIAVLLIRIGSFALGALTGAY